MVGSCSGCSLEDVLMSKMGGEDYLKGAQLSPLTELSDELSCGLMWRVQAEISRYTLLG